MLCKQKSSLFEWVELKFYLLIMYKSLIFDSFLILPSKLSPVASESSCLKSGSPLPFPLPSSWPKQLRTFVSCYQLNVSVHPTFKCWSPSCQYVGIRTWGFSELIRSWGQSPHKWDYCPYIRGSRKFPHPFYHVKIRCLWIRKWALTRHWTYQCFDLGLPAYRIVRHKCLLFKPLGCGILPQ